MTCHKVLTICHRPATIKFMEPKKIARQKSHLWTPHLITKNDHDLKIAFQNLQTTLFVCSIKDTPSEPFYVALWLGTVFKEKGRLLKPIV